MEATIQVGVWDPKLLPIIEKNLENEMEKIE